MITFSSNYSCNKELTNKFLIIILLDLRYFAYLLTLICVLWVYIGFESKVINIKMYLTLFQMTHNFIWFHNEILMCNLCIDRIVHAKTCKQISNHNNPFMHKRKLVLYRIINNKSLISTILVLIKVK